MEIESGSNAANLQPFWHYLTLLARVHIGSRTPPVTCRGRSSGWLQLDD